jgi:tetratricopeptide (TPR) repeat protein
LPELILATPFLYLVRLLTSFVMQKNTLLLVTLALFVGFAGGFWLANSINRSATNSGGPLPVPSNSNSQQTKQDPDLTDDEIKAKIDEADKTPTDFTFQKQLGISFYRYAAMKNDQNLFRQSVRILDRAHSLNPKDLDVLVTLGNAHFDLGFAQKDTAEFQKARETYSKALAVKPGDVDVQTDLGISYFVQEPPDYDKAAAELQKVPDTTEKGSRALQFLVQIFVKQNKLPEAEKTLAKLKTIDPKNDAIPELATLISDAHAGANK